MRLTLHIDFNSLLNQERNTSFLRIFQLPVIVDSEFEFLRNVEYIKCNIFGSFCIRIRINFHCNFGKN